MAEEAFARALSSLNILREGREIVLKEERETAVISLLRGQDVMAVLPTVVIFTVFALAIQELPSTRTCLLVILSLKTLTTLNFTSMEL